MKECVIITRPLLFVAAMLTFIYALEIPAVLVCYYFDLHLISPVGVFVELDR